MGSVRVNKVGMVIGVAAMALALGGCGKKVGGQVVAVVNGEEITQQEVNAELNGQQIPPTADKKAVMAQLVQRIVDRRLLVEKAKQQGLDKSPTYLAQVRRGQDGVLIGMLASNAAKTVPLPDATAADQFMAQNPSLFAGRMRYQLDQLAFQSAPNPALDAKLKPANSLEDVEKVLKEAGIPYQLGKGQLDTASIPPAVAKSIAALPAGEPFVTPQNGRILVNVIRSSEPAPVPPEQARPAAIELLRRQAVEQAMKKQVEQARKTAKISYQAGYAPPPPGAGAAPHPG